MNDKIPLVSISCITFNHENYIRDAIESFLMQKTTFLFEILIHDDASTDGTTAIIKEYELKFPDLIKPVYQTENQYSKGVKISQTYNWPRARGKYIALCEGDDYWTDPLKLQKQVDFLEENNEYGVVHGNAHFYNHSSQKWKFDANAGLSNIKDIADKRELFYRLVNADYKVRTATAFFRIELLDKREPNNMEFLMGDTPMWLDFSQMTMFKYMDEVFAVYRILPNSASRSTNDKKNFRFQLSMAEMRIYYSGKFNYPIDDKLQNRYNSALLNYLLYDSGFKPVYSMFNPNAFQKIRFKYKDVVFFQFFLKCIGKFILYAKILIQKANPL